PHRGRGGVGRRCSRRRAPRRQSRSRRCRPGRSGARPPRSTAFLAVVVPTGSRCRVEAPTRGTVWSRPESVTTLASSSVPFPFGSAAPLRQQRRPVCHLLAREASKLCVHRAVARRRGPTALRRRLCLSASMHLSCVRNPNFLLTH